VWNVFVSFSVIEFLDIIIEVGSHFLSKLKVSVSKNSVILMGFPVYMTWCFSLAVFDIVSYFV
jgi:hypothetical protein